MNNLVVDEKQELEKYINKLEIIDHHSHNLLDEPICFQNSLVSYFCEGDVTQSKLFEEQSKSTLLYKRCLKEICELYNYNSNEIEEKRSKLGLYEITRKCFDNSKINMIFLDDSFKIYHDNKSIPMKDNKWHQEFTKVKKIMRLETVLEDSLVVCKKENIPFSEWIKYLRSQVDPRENKEFTDSAIDGIKTIGYKTIVAYRTGLAIREVSLEEAEVEFNRVLCEEIIDTSLHYRVASKILIHFFIHFTMTISSSLEKPIPLQIHTGYGDPDLALEDCNPLLLKPLICKYKAPIVLLHCSYPFTREAGFLCWVYANVYIDIGLAIPFLSIEGMKQTFSSLLELCPIDKIFYSSDAHHIPESYYLSSKSARFIVKTVLYKSIKSKEITLEEAKEFALKIFRNNVIKIYNL